MWQRHSVLVTNITQLIHITYRKRRLDALPSTSFGRLVRAFSDKSLQNRWQARIPFLLANLPENANSLVEKIMLKANLSLSIDCKASCDFWSNIKHMKSRIIRSCYESVLRKTTIDTIMRVKLEPYRCVRVLVACWKERPSSWLMELWASVL